MTSIGDNTIGYVVRDRSQTVKLPDDYDREGPADSGWARYMESIKTGIPLIPDNKPDNVWGRIGLPNGDTAIIYNGGGVETSYTDMTAVVAEIEGEAARAQAIIDTFGGILQIAETADPGAPTATAPDPAALLSKMLDSPNLFDGMSGPPAIQIIPDTLLAPTGESAASSRFV